LSSKRCSPRLPAAEGAKIRGHEGRALKVKQVLDSGRYTDAFTYYPFNSGYFMCLKLKSVDARSCVSTCSTSTGSAPFQSTPPICASPSRASRGNIQELFDIIYQAVKDLC